MPIMYHFRVDKVIDSAAEQGMYKKLVNDLNTSQWNDFFEFDAKAKDMKDGEGSKFRFTAKVKQSGDIPIEIYQSQFESLAAHLQSNYGISLHDATTQRAKLKNSLIKSNKTIAEETFNELTASVNRVIKEREAIEATIEKMASMWVDDKNNVFTESQRLSSSEGLKQTSEQLSMEQEALNSTHQDAVRQQLALAATKAEIEDVNRQLDNSNLPESAKAIVEEVRNKAIPAKAKVKEIKYKTLDKNSYPDYKAIADVNTLVLSVDKTKLEQEIYHQHTSKTMLGTKSTKSPAEQEFARSYFKQNIDKAIEHISENAISTLMGAHAKVDEQFLNITKTQKAIEQQKPNDTAAEMVVADNELAKLKRALAVQHAFEARYETSKEVKHDFDDTAPSELQRNENVQKRVVTPDQTDSEATINSEHDTDIFPNENIPMYHYRIQQNIPTEDKAAYDALVTMLTNNYSAKGHLFEFICKTYKDETDKPTRFMLKINQKGSHSTNEFHEQLAKVLKTCAVHGVDVHAFEGLGSKQEFTLGKKGSYVTEEGTEKLTAILKATQAQMPKEAFDIAQNLLPQAESTNDFKKISRLVTDRDIEHEHAILAKEKSDLESELAQVQQYETINTSLHQQINAIKADIAEMAPSNKHLARTGFAVAQTKADSFAKQREALPINPKIKHPIAPRSTYPDLDSIMKYNTLVSNPADARSVLIKDGVPNLVRINKRTGVFSSEDRVDPLAQAMFETKVDDAINAAKVKLDTLQSEQEQTFALYEEVNNKDGLKTQINGKKSATEFHTENQVLHQELQALQLALELAQGMQKTQSKNVVENEELELNLTPPVPTFPPEDQVIIHEVAANVVNSAMKDALTNVMSSMAAKATKGSDNITTSPLPKDKADIAEQTHANAFAGVLKDIAKHKDENAPEAIKKPAAPPPPPVDKKPEGWKPAPPPPPPPVDKKPEGWKPAPPPPIENRHEAEATHSKPMPFDLLSAIHKGATLKTAPNTTSTEKAVSKGSALKMDLQEERRKASNVRRASTSEAINQQQEQKQKAQPNTDVRRASLNQIVSGVKLKKVSDEEKEVSKTRRASTAFFGNAKATDKMLSIAQAYRGRDSDSSSDSDSEWEESENEDNVRPTKPSTIVESIAKSGGSPLYASSTTSPVTSSDLNDAADKDKDSTKGNTSPK